MSEALRHQISKLTLISAIVFGDIYCTRRKVWRKTLFQLLVALEKLKLGRKIKEETNGKVLVFMLYDSAYHMNLHVNGENN